MLLRSEVLDGLIVEQGVRHTCRGNLQAPHTQGTIVTYLQHSMYALTSTRGETVLLPHASTCSYVPVVT
jgi:hypothetical protein